MGLVVLRRLGLDHEDLGASGLQTVHTYGVATRAQTLGLEVEGLGTVTHMPRFAIFSLLGHVSCSWPKDRFVHVKKQRGCYRSNECVLHYSQKSILLYLNRGYLCRCISVSLPLSTTRLGSRRNGTSQQPIPTTRPLDIRQFIVLTFSCDSLACLLSPSA